ncbi:MAG: hypothetical protein U0840_06990 [Gemmataceae bacterium]
MIPHRLYVGCIGEGMFRSIDRGVSFQRACDGMPFVECDVRALLVDPDQPGRLLLGSELGVFQSLNGGDTWKLLPAPVEGLRVWSLFHHQKRILAGTCPPGIVLSEDDGEHWVRAAVHMQAECPRIRYNRVTCLTADPAHPDHLYAGVEIDGIHESHDGGKTWQRIGEGLQSQDIHDLVMLDDGRMLTTTNRDLHASEDGGRTWTPQRMDRVVPWIYNRAVTRTLGTPGQVLLGAGNGPPGSEGAILLSRDGGRSWVEASMPGRANSTIWNFAKHPADTQLVYASSVSGQVYRSTDEGAHWEKLRYEFGEIRALAWEPPLA